jgi:hypothetical protein
MAEETGKVGKAEKFFKKHNITVPVMYVKIAPKTVPVVGRKGRSVTVGMQLSSSEPPDWFSGKEGNTSSSNSRSTCPDQAQSCQDTKSSYPEDNNSTYSGTTAFSYPPTTGSFYRNDNNGSTYSLSKVPGYSGSTADSGTGVSSASSGAAGTALPSTYQGQGNNQSTSAHVGTVAAASRSSDRSHSERPNRRERDMTTPAALLSRGWGGT